MFHALDHPPEGDGVEMQMLSHQANPMTGTEQPVGRMTNADAERAAARIDALKAVSTGKPPSTGHSRKYDAALEKWINDDPLVKLHQNNLNHPISGMGAALDARDPQGSRMKDAVCVFQYDNGGPLNTFYSTWLLAGQASWPEEPVHPHPESGLQNWQPLLSR